MDILNPIRDYNIGNYNGQIDTQLYLQRLKGDPMMADKKALVLKGSKIFESATLETIIDPFAGDQIDITLDFWKFKVINGMQSVRNGFFKVVSKPELTKIAGVATWNAKVLYNSGDSEKFYLYQANIGALVNRYAVGGNLLTDKIIRMPKSEMKQDFLNSLLDKVIYISRAEFVVDTKYDNMKEVLWFMLT